jgi:hypothetical protein
MTLTTGNAPAALRGGQGERPPPPDLSGRFDDYLLHEFDHVAASLVANEELGEKRVQFFLGLVTAVLGIIGLTLRGEGIALAVAVRESAVMIAGLLVVLFLFGLFTLARIVERNLATDRLKFALRAIRRRFVSRPVAAMYPNAFFDPWTAGKQRSALKLKGGWLEVVALLNAVIAAGITWVGLQRPAPRAVVLWLACAAVFLLALVLQVVVVEKRYVKEWGKLEAADRSTDVIDPRRD